MCSCWQGKAAINSEQTVNWFMFFFFVFPLATVVRLTFCILSCWKQRRAKCFEERKFSSFFFQWSYTLIRARTDTTVQPKRKWRRSD